MCIRRSSPWWRVGTRMANPARSNATWNDAKRDRSFMGVAAAAPGEGSGDGIDGAVLAAGMVRTGRAAALAFESSAGHARSARAQGRFPGCAPSGGPIVGGRSGRKLRSGGRTTELALADAHTGGAEAQDRRGAQPGGRIAGRGRREAGGGGERCVRRQWLGDAGAVGEGRNRCSGDRGGGARVAASQAGATGGKLWRDI